MLENALQSISLPADWKPLAGSRPRFEQVGEGRCRASVTAATGGTLREVSTACDDVSALSRVSSDSAVTDKFFWRNG